MKKFIIFILAALISVVSAESITLELVAGKTKGKGARQTLPSGLFVSASVSEDKVIINLTDGKQKFGKPNIVFKKGDVTYTHPRLMLHVDLAKAKAVTAGKPLSVTAFTHNENPYEITIVKGSGEMPSVVFTEKK